MHATFQPSPSFEVLSLVANLFAFSRSRRVARKPGEVLGSRGYNFLYSPIEIHIFRVCRATLHNIRLACVGCRLGGWAVRPSLCRATADGNTGREFRELR